MFLRNTTSLEVSLASGHVTDRLAVASVVVSTAWRTDTGVVTRCREAIPAGANDPPPEVTRFPLWRGVSVTAAGHAAGPPQPPYVCPVILRVGTAERRLIVFGERRWERRLGGSLEPSPALPFDRLALSFESAFGGGYDLPPGLLPGTDLPHPGFRVAHQLNANGVGFYPDEAAATGACLPSVERPDQLVRRWNDAPDPAGFTPCPDLVAWRLRDAIPAKAEDDRAEATLLRVLRARHHAPPSLIFEDVPSGTLIDLSGLGHGPMRFVVPAAPAQVSTVGAGKRETEVRPRLRALHLDADSATVRLYHAHTFHYDPARAPRWVRVTDARREPS